MTRTISRISVSTKLSVVSPGWAGALGCGVTGVGRTATPGDSKAGTRSRPLGIAPLVRGSAAWSLSGAPSGANTGGNPSHDVNRSTARTPAAAHARPHWRGDLIGVWSGLRVAMGPADDPLDLTLEVPAVGVAPRPLPSIEQMCRRAQTPPPRREGDRAYAGRPPSEPVRPAEQDWDPASVRVSGY